MDVLSPKGAVGMHERTLILVALGLMCVVVVPTIVLTLVFAWRYRASNTKATYAPKWSHSTAIEVVMWAIPCVIIVILGAITWTSTHELDPYRPLESSVKPVTIEAVALDWKWLFIYPDYGVASVNQIAFPEGTPVDFKITSGTVMNAFFIPQLGSQVYAMSGMQTQVHLIANEKGSYDGFSSNFSGPGFADMHFTALATSQKGFEAWIAKAKASAGTLDVNAYQSLLMPSRKVPVSFYGTVSPNMFGYIIKHPATNGAPAASAAPSVAAVPSHSTHAQAAE